MYFWMHDAVAARTKVKQTDKLNNGSCLESGRRVRDKDKGTLGTRRTRVTKLQTGSNAHLVFCLSVSVARDGGPAAGSGSSRGSGAGPLPRAAVGAQEPAGPGAELCDLIALRGGRTKGWPAGHRHADHPGCQVSESVLSCAIFPLLSMMPNNNFFWRPL